MPPRIRGGRGRRGGGSRKPNNRNLNQGSKNVETSAPASNAPSASAVNDAIDMSASYTVGGGFWNRATAMGKMGAASFRSSFGEGATWGTMAKGMGGHMVRGAVAGGLIGGTMEAAQGGSFWSGAKEGAWNGAIGWGAWRAAGRMTGASTRNPLRAFGNGGVARNAGTMWSATSGNPEVSKQAQALLNQAQRNALARHTMNR